MPCRTWILGFFLLIAGCAAPPKQANDVQPAPKPPTDPWVLRWNDPKSGAPALLWNGLIGIRLGRDGTGIANAFFDIRAYQPDGEEKIKPLPNPLQGKWTAGSKEAALDPAQGYGYEQSLDMRTGLLTTQWRQEVDGVDLSVKSEAVVDPDRRLVAQRWTIGGDDYVPLSLNGKIEGIEGGVNTTESAGLRTRYEWPGSRMLATARYRVGPDHRRIPPNARLMAPLREQHGPLVFGAVDKGKVFTFERSVAFGPLKTSTGDPDASATDPELAFESAAKRVVRAWAKKWETDIEIDGPVEDQQAIRSFLFYLRSSIHPREGMSISPFGLSATQYNGHVFWDADVWVFPALMLLDTDRALAIPEYRLWLERAARNNFEGWLRAGKPNASNGTAFNPVETPESEGGLMYPWESSVTGKETVPGPSKWQHHITGTVAFGLAKAAALGLIPAEDAARVRRGAATFYMARSEPGPNGREIKATMSPDEHFTGDNDLYTNLLAEWTTGGKTRFKRPQDDQGFLTYDGDTLRGYKQAAAVLAIYPLQHPEAEKQAKTMMERFSGKTTRNGPAMSDSIHALIWARLGDPDMGYRAWRASWEPFTDNSLMLFSEKRNKDLSYFTTGAAGSLQTVLYGFAGFRLDWERRPSAKWSMPLKGGSWLSVEPHLPPQWKSIKVKNFTVLGRRLTLTVSQEGVQVAEGD